MATILTVDDEPMILDLIKTLLKGLGHSVITAGGASEAIEKFNKYPKKIDLLISDIGMPDMDGISLAGKLQAGEPELKVLLMSGGCNRRQVPSAYEFLPKPFALADMIARVDHLCDRRPVGVTAAAEEGAAADLKSMAA